ncbi:hypothetical protein [Hymenobacter sp. CRA2]|uniref:hypothetical protein n=1 Tax=Hymenobacter sp. CRA2 TaxID=1955620 RepID=UPI00098FA7E1|nr:hypothetical protein [Hymenobacter sp. CRA2]OON70677.1 hypothetical protein B0919_01275 [Hymenobacter sp. CRA2]
MSFPVSLLRTQAECDAALAALQLELREFTVRDQQLDLRADKSADRATERASALQQATEEVTRLTPLVSALTPGTKEHRALQRMLTQASRRAEDLSATAAGSTQTPVDAFLQAVDVRQVQVQVPELQQAIAELTAHRAGLPA